MKFDLIGGGGGGSKIKNVPDNLRSVDSYEAVIGLGSTRMRLAPGGLQNLFINAVPVEDRDRQSNFADFTAFLFDGDPTLLEPVNLVMGQSAGATVVNLSVSNDYTGGQPGDWVTAAITTPNCDFIDLRLVVQQLYAQTKKGVKEQTATIEVELRPSGASGWINPLIDNAAPAYDPNGIAANKFGGLYYKKFEAWRQDASGHALGLWNDPNPGQLTFRGKTTSQFVRELRIAVPNTGAYANKTWQVRMRLLEQDYVVSGDDGENEDRRTIAWESIAGVSSKKFGGTEAWRGVSYLQIYGKATDQIAGDPTVTGIYDIGEYPIPPASVWDNINRTFTGFAWDGVTNDIGWTQCPAWQVKGIIEDDLSGLSALTPGSTLNKWDALEASKWFATRVPDGRGGTHPRYSANWYLEEGMQTHDLVNYLSGAVGAYCWDEGSGQWRMKVEKPEAAAHIFTKENIVGEFTYAHTDFDSRYNDFIGVFRNKDNLYQEDRVRVWDQANIDNTGRRHTSVALVGCDNRQEALRRCKIRLLTALHEYRIVTFTTNRQGLLLEPFTTIAVADGDLMHDTTLRSTGRVIEIDSTDPRIIYVRDPLRLEPGVEYELQLTIANPDYNPNSSTQPTSEHWRNPTQLVTRKVVNPSAERGDVVKLYLDAALPEGTPEYAVVTLSAPGLPTLPKPYRVTNVTQDGSNPELVTITATEIYTPKWIESDNVSEDELFAQIPNRSIASPTAPPEGMFSVKTFQGETGLNRILTVTWVRPATMFLKNYRVEYQVNGGPWISWGNTIETSLEMQNPEFGVYVFRVYAVDRRGFESLPLEGTYGFDEMAGDNRPVGALTAESVVVAAEFDGSVLDWSPASGDFRLFDGASEFTSGISFEVLPGALGGIVAHIDPVTGEYSVSGMSDDQGRVTFRATFAGVPIERSLSIAKARRGVDGIPGPAGEPGTEGVNTTIVHIYQRSKTLPALPTGVTQYNFATNDVTGLNMGWVSRIPEGTDPIWVSVASVSTASLTDYIGANEWTDPVILTQNGVNTATIYLFQRTDTPIPPKLPSVNATYTFATKTITGVNNGWVSSLPTTGGRYRWITMGTALSDGPSDIIPPDDWTAASLLAVDGVDGKDADDVAAPVTIDMSLSSVALWAYANGIIPDYSEANGQFTIRKGTLNLTNQATYTHSSTPGVTAWVNAAGSYGVTRMTTDTGSVTFTITVDGVVYSRVLSISRTKAGYEIVSNLPVNDLFVGRMVFLTSNNKLYRYTPSGWTAAVAFEDLPSTLVRDIQRDLNLANIAGKITKTQISDEAIDTPQLAARAIQAHHIAAGAIRAENLTLANRGAYAQDFHFRIENGILRWDPGVIFWINDAGANQSTYVSGGSAAWPGNYVHIVWQKNATSFTVVNANWEVGLGANNLEMAVWQGGTSLTVYYGATIIDGDRIQANSIKARNMAANSIMADHIQGGQITAAKLASTELITMSAQIRNGIIDMAKIRDLQVTNAHIQNLTIGPDKLAYNAATQLWYTASQVQRTPVNSLDFTVMLSIPFTKYGGAETSLQYDVQCPMYGPDAVKVEVFLDVWRNGALVANRGLRMEVDGNNQTYLPFIYQHVFQGLPAGGYEAKFVMRRTSPHDCYSFGLYHMIVREFKR